MVSTEGCLEDRRGTLLRGGWLEQKEVEAGQGKLGMKLQHDWQPGLHRLQPASCAGVTLAAVSFNAGA